jgi:hypothetical protein
VARGAPKFVAKVYTKAEHSSVKKTLPIDSGFADVFASMGT